MFNLILKLDLTRSQKNHMDHFYLLLTLKVQFWYTCPDDSGASRAGNEDSEDLARACP